MLRWLGQPGTRLVLASRPWKSRAGRFRSYLDTEAVRRAAEPFADRRRLRTEARPAMSAYLVDHKDGRSTTIVMVRVEPTSGHRGADRRSGRVSEVYSVAATST